MLHRFYKHRVGNHSHEECYYFDLSKNITEEQIKKITEDLLGTNPEWKVSRKSVLKGPVVEVGPRIPIETAFSSNAVSICTSIGIPAVRVEMSNRFATDDISSVDIDPLIQEIYATPLKTFATDIIPEPVRIIPLLDGGLRVLRKENKKLGLGLDEQDMLQIMKIFRKLRRNPTDVELTQIANGNSEHSRHHYFGGKLTINSKLMPESLMTIVQKPWKINPGNSLVAFHDNAGVFRGTSVPVLVPTRPGQVSSFGTIYTNLHHTITAETHNHPTMIAPFPGAETGVGGRIRDSRAVGRGGLTHAGITGYSVGALHIPGHYIAGEENPPLEASFVTPLEILIRGSNGASDYANKIGEPLVCGYTRSFEQLVNGELRSYAKPILYTAGIGRVFDYHVRKRAALKGMLVIRFGGPAFPIGMGGGSASSMIQGTNDRSHDLQSVQRGDAEMENRAIRVIQTCAEFGEHNPIDSIHDQGAGGPSNVLTELMDPNGGIIDIQKITLGDKTMSERAIWVAEFQEGFGVLVRPENLLKFQAICKRENVNCEVVGTITDSGRITVINSANNTTPVDLCLHDILSGLPSKSFSDVRIPLELRPFKIQKLYDLERREKREFTTSELFNMVLSRLDIGSKGFLTRKIDRSVTGLVVQQPCCGPFQIPVADYGITADSYLAHSGQVVAVGEQPIKMLVNPERGARMSVAELITNLMGAKIDSLANVRCRANWMIAAKLQGQGAILYDAAVAMSDFMIELGIAIDGGKDSLSMAAQLEDRKVVAPGTLVVLGSAHVPDFRKRVTPDCKGNGVLGLINLAPGKYRLGGSSLAQTLDVLGDDCPDVEDVALLKRAFEAMQELVENNLITACHDRSDGGLIVTVAEMAMAGNCGSEIHLYGDDLAAQLFAEEAGIVFECPRKNWTAVKEVLTRHNVTGVEYLGVTQSSQYTATKKFEIFHNEDLVLSEDLASVRSKWEATSTAIEYLQANPKTVAEEEELFESYKSVQYHSSFVPKKTRGIRSRTVNVAVVREEGTNGDREMIAMFKEAGCTPYDINMKDLLSGEITSFDCFQALVFPGGFSFADTFGSAVGWAARIRHNEKLQIMFTKFFNRKDTLVLGVCNGCQLMPLLGLLPYEGIVRESQPRFVHNTSGRFESRWTAVKIKPNSSIFLKGMEGSVLGVHVAHGEGRVVFPDQEIANYVQDNNLAPLAYVDTDGNPTENYPHNPNGSPLGYAGLCSPDGRFLAMMPHPERCYLPWQWPYVPEEWKSTFEVSPWLQIALNARDWGLEHQ